MKTFTTYAEKKAKQFLNLLQGYTKGIRMTAILILLLMGVSNAWGAVGYNGESHVYLKVNGTTKYYKVSTESWSTGASLNGTWGGVLKDQTFSNIYELQIVGGAVGGWTDYGESISGTLYYKITTTTTTPSSGWSNFGSIASKSTYNGKNCFFYKDNGSTDVTPHTSGTHYLHIKITDGGGNNRTSYVKITVPSYTVAGSSAILGTDWDVTDTNNDMVWSTGTKYTLTKSNVTLNKNTTYKCKVAFNHAWTTAYPNQDKEFTVNEDGNYNVTFTFDASSKTVEVSTTRLYAVIYNGNNQTSGSEPATSYYLSGSTITVASNSGNLSKTGYDFDGWNEKSDGKGTNYTAGSGTFTMPSSNTTLYAKWTAKNITINWNANGGSVSPASSTYTYDGAAIELPTPSYAGHRFLGWFTAANGGTQITDVGTTNKPYTTVTYYAHWEVSIVEHKVTFGVGTNYTSYGSLTAATSSGNINSGANIVEGTSVTFTATPNTGYEVEGWYTDAACTEGKHNAGSTTYTTTITDVTNVYVKFVEKTWSVTFVAGTGGTITEPASTPQTVGEVTGITVIAEAEKGYTFSGWTSSNGGKFDDSKSGKTTFKPTAATTVTASFTENLYAITVESSDNNHGTVTQSTDKAGIATTIAITATPVLGYRFVNWTATSGITIADANSTTTTITASAAGTVTANFELIPPTTIYVKSNGQVVDFKWNYNSVAYDMTSMDCAGTYYTANVLGGIDEITLTGSNNSFTTTTLTVPTDGKTLYDLTSTNITHVYLTPNSNWKTANARFAAYFYGSTGNAWQSMTAVGTSGYYEAEIPAGSWTGVIFCRMNPSTSANNWDNKWTQTNDLTLSNNNHYTIAANASENDGSKSNGTWSTIWDNSRWTTYSAPTLELRINITGKGSIVIDGETYTSESKGTTTLRVSKTNGESIAIGAITAADRWEYNNDAQITMCDETIDLAASHTINGPATIDLSFTQTSCEVVFNLNMPRGTEHPSIPAQYVAVGEKATKPTLNEINGYIFGGWYSDKNCTQAYNFENSVTTDITIHAKWVLYSQCIFFRNTLGWKDIYVYTFSDDMWHKGDNQEDAKDDKGVQPKINRIEYGKMTQMGESDIYYYILTNLTGFSHIAFKDNDQSGYDYFFGGNAIYRSDRNDQMPLFIPEKDQFPSTTNSTKYYSNGIWMKYNSTESGYEWRGATSEDANDSGWSNAFKFTTDKPGGYSFKASVNFDNINQHYFKVRNYNNTWFGNGGTMTQNNCTDWIFGSDNSNNAKITPTITGTYIFTVYLGDGVVKVSLDFPLSTGDYRLVYVDNVTGVHPGHYIKKRNEDRLDTVSFFVHHQNSPRILLQHCTAISNSGVPTWKTDKEYQILKTGGADPTSAQLPGKRKSDAVLYAGEGCGIEESGVYNFVLQQSNSTADLQTAYTHPYVGDFYIRTDAADGGWDAFRQQSNKITYSSFADSHSNFNHYYCKYINAGRNVKFTIANDYSYCISDTLDNDDIIEKGQSSKGCLPDDANVRFGWDSNTNEISRAYIKGAGITSDRFLVLQGKDGNLTDANGGVLTEGEDDTPRYGLRANEEILVDQQNWIYQVDVTANNQTFVKLIAEYNGTTQYFKGNETEYTRLLSSSATKNYKIRLIYDFKSNHLVIAWLAGGNTVTNTEILGADMMVIRRNQQPAEQLNFNPQNSSMMDSVKTGYAVMTFTKAHLENLQEEDNKTPLPENQKKTERERSLYWVSFPFDVKISDVFGFGEYAEHWILQYYDGAERAKKGLFSDSGTYWKYIFDTDTELKAGQGYVLVLDLSKVEFLYGATEVSLYFPSTNPLTTISGVLPTEAIVPEHWCNIDREWTEGGTKYHHKYTDSHWNLIGVPGFADINNFDDGGYHFMQEDVSFYYKFDLTKSIYTVEKNYTVEHATNFQAMYSYMVQFAGKIYWMSKTVEGVTPTEIAARRYSDDQPEKVALRLELAQGEEVADRTFVQLQQEGATANFDLSLDLTKIVNIGVSNIYTLTDSLKIQTAGNVLPFEETTVAVGVDIATAGEYTFRMPDGTEGMVVELIDYETNTTTNLLLDDYTVNLPAGSNETRFALSLKPEKTATSIESTTTPSDSNIRKFIIDGKLYLQKDGMLYDAQGRCVK